MNKVERIFYWEKLVCLDPLYIFKQVYVKHFKNMDLVYNPFLALVKKP